MNPSIEGFGEKKNWSLNLLNEQLNKLLDLKMKEMLQQWDRSVPMGDLFLDRWSRAQKLGFCEGVSIYDSSVVIGDVKVGKHSWIGPFTVIDGSGGLTIGEYCSISAGVHIYSHDTVDWALSGGEKDIVKEPVIIGNRCYIGPHSIISKGVSIGNGCVIGANSFVNRNIPDGRKAWGNPCTIKGIAN